MKIMIRFLLFLCLASLLVACSGSPYRHVSEGEVIETRYVTYMVPDTNWQISKKYTSDTWSSGIWAQLAGVTYDIGVKNYPLPPEIKEIFFDRQAVLEQVLRDEDMQLTSNDKEQGIGYTRQWLSYMQGLKCSEGVFSRTAGGVMASISNKNYTLNCGYYDKEEGKRLLSISYRYNYAGGPVRHEADKNTPREELLTREQAEMALKHAVKEILSTLRIKNMDRERMEREGLIYVDKEYTISPY